MTESTPDRRARGFRSSSAPAVDGAVSVWSRGRIAHQPSLGRGLVWSEFLRHMHEEWAAADAAREAENGVRRLDRPAPDAPDEQAGAAA